MKHPELHRYVVVALLTFPRVATSLMITIRKVSKPKSMNRSNLHSKLIRLLLVIIITGVTAQGLLATRTIANGVATVPQYDDPYSDFRNVRYSNAGLLNERDEIKLGAQLHREVTKKYNLTDVGLDRVDRIGQRCARASLRPSLVYKFHVIQGREINGFSIPGGHVYVTTALVRLANDNELGAVLCHEVGHLVARHHYSLPSDKPSFGPRVRRVLHIARPMPALTLWRSTARTAT